jgi:hypothetical protein
MEEEESAQPDIMEHRFISTIKGLFSKKPKPQEEPQEAR